MHTSSTSYHCPISYHCLLISSSAIEALTITLHSPAVVEHHASQAGRGGGSEGESQEAAP